MEVPRPEGRDVNVFELSLLDWGAHFISSPNETIDFEPCRTYSPTSRTEIPEWRVNFRNYLCHSANQINRNYPDQATGDWITVEKFFLEQVVYRLPKRYNLPRYSDRYTTRRDYVIDLFRTLSNYGVVFGKNPKWLNDFSGQTIELFHQLKTVGIPIQGIFLTRCPADTFTSILERKLRVDEMFAGNLDKCAEFTAESVEFSAYTGLSLANKYNFPHIHYESMTADFSQFLSSIDLIPTTPISYERKYGRRYVLNPRARHYASRLQTAGYKLGYGNYLKKVTLAVYLKELLLTMYRVRQGSKFNINNPETMFSILIKCFWLEAETPRMDPIRKFYRIIIKKSAR
jgi:hypothetical protein